MSQTTGEFGKSVLPRGDRATDLICIGRGIADLYSDQLGGRLEDAISFSAYIGGSALNICMGVQRLGLQTAMVLRVGDDHMGRLVRETMERNGVDTRAVKADPVAPTPLCILGVRDRSTFPRDLFTEGGAYLNLVEDDLDPQLFANARALLINGSFFATETLRQACRKALALARQAGCVTALDVDYRPALWGLVGHGSGEAAFVESAEVTAHFAQFLPEFDLVVGTEEEIAIAGGSPDSLEAARRIRALSNATIVMKRGAAGCVAFDGPVPDDAEKGVVVPGFKVELMNTAGAGDSFMAGLVAGWLTNQGLGESCRLANACGAVNVARHGCSDSAPSDKEISVFMAKGGVLRPDEDSEMRHLHALLGRQPKKTPTALADLTSGKICAQDVVGAVQSGRVDGVLWPATDSFADLAPLTGQGTWIARALPPLSGFAGGVRLMAEIRRWPREHIVWLDRLDAQDTEKLVALAEVAAETRHEILIDLSGDENALATAQAVIAAGVRPEWWMIAQAEPALEAWIAALDIPSRGVILRDQAVLKTI